MSNITESKIKQAALEWFKGLEYDADDVFSL